MRDAPYHWTAFDCKMCPLVFDVRSEEPIPTAKCPVCGTWCEAEAAWPETARGYGSRADTVDYHAQILRDLNGLRALAAEVEELARAIEQDAKHPRRGNED